MHFGCVRTSADVTRSTDHTHPYILICVHICLHMYFVCIRTSSDVNESSDHTHQHIFDLFTYLFTYVFWLCENSWGVNRCSDHICIGLHIYDDLYTYNRFTYVF